MGVFIPRGSEITDEVFSSQGSREKVKYWDIEMWFFSLERVDNIKLYLRINLHILRTVGEEIRIYLYR